MAWPTWQQLWLASGQQPATTKPTPANNLVNQLEAVSSLTEPKVTPPPANTLVAVL